MSEYWTELVMPRWALIFTIAMFVICLFFVWIMAAVFTANKIWEDRRNDDVLDQP